MEDVYLATEDRPEEIDAERLEEVVDRLQHKCDEAQEDDRVQRPGDLATFDDALLEEHLPDNAAEPLRDPVEPGPWLRAARGDGSELAPEVDPEPPLLDPEPPLYPEVDPSSDPS